MGNHYNIPPGFRDIKNKQDQQPEYKNLPHWFTFVVKSMLHGVYGPSGTVNKLPEMLFKTLYNGQKEMAKTVWN